MPAITSPRPHSISIKPLPGHAAALVPDINASLVSVCIHSSKHCVLVNVVLREYL